MEKLQFKIDINAQKEKVWNTMLDDKTYRIWTEEFTPGSHYVGNWNKGAKFLFLGPALMEKLAEWLAELKTTDFMNLFQSNILVKCLMELRIQQAIVLKSGLVL